MRMSPTRASPAKWPKLWSASLRRKMAKMQARWRPRRRQKMKTRRRHQRVSKRRMAKVSPRTTTESPRRKDQQRTKTRSSQSNQISQKNQTRMKRPTCLWHMESARARKRKTSMRARLQRKKERWSRRSLARQAHPASQSELWDWQNASSSSSLSPKQRQRTKKPRARMQRKMKSQWLPLTVSRRLWGRPGCGDSQGPCGTIQTMMILDFDGICVHICQVPKLLPTRIQCCGGANNYPFFTFGAQAFKSVLLGKCSHRFIIPLHADQIEELRQKLVIWFQTYGTLFWNPALISSCPVVSILVERNVFWCYDIHIHNQWKVNSQTFGDSRC